MKNVTIAEVKRMGREDALAGEDFESIAENIRLHYGITHGHSYLTAARNAK